MRLSEQSEHLGFVAIKGDRNQVLHGCFDAVKPLGAVGNTACNMQLRNVLDAG